MTGAESQDFDTFVSSFSDSGGVVGVGMLAHATASANRDSITEWGLDWKRMAAAPGIAGSRSPELEAVFLDHIQFIEFFTRMSRVPSDVWEVDVTGLWIEKHEDWLIHRSPIATDRLRLVERDLPARIR